MIQTAFLIETISKVSHVHMRKGLDESQKICDQYGNSFTDCLTKIGSQLWTRMDDAKNAEMEADEAWEK